MLAALVIGASMLTWQPNTTEDTVKHVGTGMAIGAAGQGLCIEASRMAYEGRSNKWECLAGVMFFSSLLYSVKEGYDAQKYNGGRFDGTDTSEGLGGTVLGAGIYLPIVEW